MMIRSLKSALLVTTSLLASLGQQAFAQNSADEDAPSWYEVELIIYANRTPTVEDQPELWSRKVNLSYPERWVALTEEQPENTLSDLSEETPLEQQALAQERPEEILQKKSEAELVNTEPEAFEVLPEESLQLQKTKERMERSRRYQVLFHKNWRQIISDKKEMPSILIEGGGEFGGLRELSGYITLHRSRYLHIESNLWLSHFIANTGEQTGEEWPYLPLAPNKIDLDKLELLQIDDVVEGDLPLSTNGDHTVTTATSSSFENTLPEPAIDTNNWSLLGYDDLAQSTFVPERIVTLQQRRKMRSSELHNLDHPLFGLLIKLTPYELVSPESTNESVD
ncbi:MAG: peptidoglycan binding protein CsiV [Cellvibrionaceae bacterium]